MHQLLWMEEAQGVKNIRRYDKHGVILVTQFAEELSRLDQNRACFGIQRLFKRRNCLSRSSLPSFTDLHSKSCREETFCLSWRHYLLLGFWYLLLIFSCYFNYLVESLHEYEGFVFRVDEDSIMVQFIDTFHEEYDCLF